MPAAIYARYSTDLQSEASIADQIRVCERLAERHGFEVAARFHDAAISGGTAQRPGYQAMLEAARRGAIDVIVAEDTSRLWRNMAEQMPRMAELADLGVHVVTHDLDTRTESAGMLSAVLGASSEAYRREIGRRTRRGLEGLARARKPTGGRSYGYLSAAQSGTGDRAVEPGQAEIVREIFRRFADGETMRAIAASLNERGVPSAGAAWKRSLKTTDGFWRVSALHTMLRNELYVGRVIWNRCHWVRSAADSRKRRYVENPRSEWIVHERPDLRIVDQRTWQRVQARCTEQVEVFGNNRGGRASYMLSGLLRCAECGGAYVITHHHPPRYGCSTHRQAGEVACSNRLRVASALAERKILDFAKRNMLSAEAVDLAVAEMKRLAKEDAHRPPPVDTSKLEAQIGELKRLRGLGVLSDEVAGAALKRAYHELEQAKAPTDAPTAPVFGAEREYREMMQALRDAVDSDDVPIVREALRELLPAIKLHPRSGRLVAEIDVEEIPLVGAGATPVVAGVGFEPTTFGL